MASQFIVPRSPFIVSRLADFLSILLSLAQSAPPLIRRPRLLHRG